MTNFLIAEKRHMAPTILLECTTQRGSQHSSFTMMGKAQRFSRGQSAGFIPDYRHAVETVGESEGFVSSGRVDSEDSSAPKRKCISLNTDRCDGFNVPMQVISISKMSSSDRKELEIRLRTELEQIQILQKKILSRAVNGVAVSSTTDASGKKRPAAGPNTPQLKRGHSGRFEPTKSAPLPPGSSSTNAALTNQCVELVNRLLEHPYGWIFQKPVDIVELKIPDYPNIIKHPMDLGTVKSKLTSGAYSSLFDFASDVKLTFDNARTYNPPKNDVHVVANVLSKQFESKWKLIRKKISPLNSNVAREVGIAKPSAQTKKRKAPTVNQTPAVPASVGSVRNEVESVKEKMTPEEKQKLSSRLESLITELPEHIIEFLKRSSGNQSQTSDDEIEIDIDALGDSTLFQLQKLLDEFRPEKGSKQEKKCEPEMEILNESGISNSSMQMYKVNEPPGDEEVDIVGNDLPISSYPPVEIEKDTALRSSKCSSSSSSSSDSGSSSSDSDSASSSGSESLVPKCSPLTNNLKETGVPGEVFEQEKGDTMDLIDSNRYVVDGSEQPEQSIHPKAASAEADGHQEGGNALSERQVSPEKLYRAALLRNRFADTILKAREKTLDKGEKGDPEKLRREREELERQQREEKARLQAEAKAAEDARREAEAKAAAEAKRKRELDREAARQALMKMEKTVEINENSQFLKDLEMLRSAPGEHLPSSVDETSPDHHSQDGIGGFKFRGNNPLEQLGLYMKVDDEEEDEVEPAGVPTNDVEEGEID